MERLAGNEGGGGKSEEQKGQPRNKQLLLCKEANNACAMSKTARVLRLGQAWSRVVSWYGSAESNLVALRFRLPVRDAVVARIASRHLACANLGSRWR